jgi:hypothetical protein
MGDWKTEYSEPNFSMNSLKLSALKKPPRNSAGFCGGGQGLSWAVEPRKEEEEEGKNLFMIIILICYN